jgi:hypothetical protein
MKCALTSTIGNERQSILDDQMIKLFFAQNPEEPRAAAGICDRWTCMKNLFKYYRPTFLKLAYI